MDTYLNTINDIFYDFTEEEVSLVALINHGDFEVLPEEVKEELKAYKEFQVDPEKVLSVRIIATEEDTLKGLVLSPVHLFYEIDGIEDKKKIIPEEYNIASLYIDEEGDFLIGSLIEVLEEWIFKHDLRVEYEKYLDEKDEN